MDITSFILGFKKGKATGGSSGGGGGSLPAGLYLTASQIQSPTNYMHKRFMFNGELYATWYNAAGSGYANRLSKWNGSAWESVLSSQLGTMDAIICSAVEYNGKMHFFDMKQHYVFDGTTFTDSTDLPGDINGLPVVYQGKIVVYIPTEKSLYEWDDANAVWVKMAEVASNTYTYYSLFTYNDILYVYRRYKLYIYDNGVMTEVASVSDGSEKWRIYNGKAVSFKSGKAYFVDLSTYDETTYTIPNGYYIEYVIPNDLSFGYYTSSSSNNYMAFFDVTIIEATE